MPDDGNPQGGQANPTPEASIRAALQAIADGIADGSKLTVSTSVQVLDTSSAIQVGREKIEVARTEISIDGDREEVVPVIINAGSLEVPRAIQELHEQHVAEALAYRKQLLDTLVDFVKTRRLG
jgi:hypothetical protein